MQKCSLDILNRSILFYAYSKLTIEFTYEFSKTFHLTIKASSFIIKKQLLNLRTRPKTPKIIMSLSLFTTIKFCSYRFSVIIEKVVIFLCRYQVCSMKPDWTSVTLCFMALSLAEYWKSISLFERKVLNCSTYTLRSVWHRADNISLERLYSINFIV